MKNIIVAI